ncbi:MAG TPA: hypothetical protein VGI92_08185 [Gemmatimonadales bacterium]
MPDASEVTCDDPGVRQWVADWLASWRIAPPGRLSLRISVSDVAVGEADEREPFRQPLVEIRSGPPHNDLRIRWLAGNAIAVLDPKEPRADIIIAPAALADRERLQQTFLVAVVVFLLRRAGWHHVHGAIARDRAGREWLLAGDAKAGKSTTAALLATHGWSVGTDDLTFLAAADDAVDAHAPHIPIALREGGAALLAARGGAPARGGRKQAFFPEELGGSFASRARPTILMFPRVEGAVTRIEPLTPGAALAELVKWSAWVALEPEFAQLHLDLLAALARQARAFRLSLGPDLFEGKDLLMSLVP